jgi:hypothetical protein
MAVDLQRICEYLQIPLDKFVYPCSDVEVVEYVLETDKLHHSHLILRDGTPCMQYGHEFKVNKIVALYVRADGIDDWLDEKGYWVGEPSVQPMIPNSNFGYFRVTGTYMEAPEQEMELESE